MTTKAFSSEDMALLAELRANGLHAEANALEAELIAEATSRAVAFNDATAPHRLSQTTSGRRASRSDRSRRPQRSVNVSIAIYLSMFQDLGGPFRGTIGLRLSEHVLAQFDRAGRSASDIIVAVPRHSVSGTNRVPGILTDLQEAARARHEVSGLEITMDAPLTFQQEGGCNVKVEDEHIVSTSRSWFNWTAAVFLPEESDADAAAAFLAALAAPIVDELHDVEGAVLGMTEGARDWAAAAKSTLRLIAKAFRAIKREPPAGWPFSSTSWLSAYR